MAYESFRGELGRAPACWDRLDGMDINTRIIAGECGLYMLSGTEFREVSYVGYARQRAEFEETPTRSWNARAIAFPYCASGSGATATHVGVAIAGGNWAFVLLNGGHPVHIGPHGAPVFNAHDLKLFDNHITT